MIDYHADEDAEVYAVYVAVDPYEPVGKLCVDYLSKEALQKFIASTHENIGSTLKRSLAK